MCTNHVYRILLETQFGVVPPEMGPSRLELAAAILRPRRVGTQ